MIIDHETGPSIFDDLKKKTVLVSLKVCTDDACSCVISHSHPCTKICRKCNKSDSAVVLVKKNNHVTILNHVNYVILSCIAHHENY